MTTTTLPTKSPPISRPPTAPILRALILKELRQNLIFLALIFLLDFVLIVAFEWLRSDFLSYYFGRGSFFTRPITEINILLNPSIRTSIPIVCVTSALLLGIFQPLADLNFDRWSFLIHRPVSRSTFFLGRALAGLILYFLAAGLPLLILFTYAMTSHQYFIWQYTQPALADFSAALAFYFAGLLIAERQALFYGSRIVSIILAFTASIAAATLPSFLLALLIPLLITLLLAAAARASQTTHGYTLTAPAPHRRALTLTLFLAFSLALFFLCSNARETINAKRDRILYPAAADNPPHERKSRPPATISLHVLYPDGTIAIKTITTVSGAIGKNSQILDYIRIPDIAYTDLQGHPIPAPDENKFTQIESLGTGLVTPIESEPSYRNLDALVTLWHQPLAAPAADLFFFDHTKNLIFIYREPPFQFRGTLGANGFAPPNSRAQPFPPEVPPSFVRPIVTQHAIYNIDFIRYTITPFFTAPPGEIITAYRHLSDPNNYKSEQYPIVVTNSHIFQLSPNSQVLHQFPLTHELQFHDLGIVYYPTIHRWIIHDRLWHDTGTQQFVTEFYDDNANLLASDSFSIDAESGRLPLDQLTHRELAKIQSINLKDGLASALANPLALLSANISWHALFAPTDPRKYDPITEYKLYNLPTTAPALLTLSLTLLLTAALTFLAASLYRLSHLAKILWTLLALLTGPAALLTLLATHSLPRRTQCPACQKPRPLASDLCPHCHSPFPPPLRTGTEIFTA